MEQKEIDFISQSYKECKSYARTAKVCGVSVKSVKKALLLAGVLDFKTESLDLAFVKEKVKELGIVKASKFFKIETSLFSSFCKQKGIFVPAKSIFDVISLEDYKRLVSSVSSYSELVNLDSRFKSYSQLEISSHNVSLGIGFGKKSKPLSELHKKILDLIKSTDLTYADIGKKFSISGRTVYRIAKANGISRKGRNNPFAYSEEEILKESNRLVETYGWVSGTIIKTNSKLDEKVFSSYFGGIKEMRAYYGLSDACTTQEKFLDFFEKITGIKLKREYRLDLINGSRRQRFDGYNEELRLAVEYDTRDHFIPFEHFGGKKTLELAQRNDQDKNIFCANNNIKLFRFSYDLPWDKELIFSKLKDLNII